MNTEATSPAITHTRVIEPPTGWQMIDFRELRGYRDLFFFLVKRDIKVMYAQTILGFAWAILSPLIQIVVFSIVFGRLAQIDTDGIPYFLFSTIAIIPWTYMSSGMSSSSQSLVSSSSMLGKIYFPRIIYPITPVLSHLVDFTISLLLLVAVMAYYGVVPGVNIVFLPIFLVMMVGVPIAVGLWLSSLAIRFRDVRFAMGFVIKMLIYSAPILYSASQIPDEYRIWYSLNPVVGVVEGFRACLLGTEIPWMFVWPGFLTLIIMLATGAMYFRRMERVIVDVI